jgi:cobalt-zinc-cadmium efflux system membrane fusion protein
MRRIIYKISILSIVFSLWSCADKENQTLDSDSQNTNVTDERVQVTQAQFEKTNMLLGKLEEKPFHTVVKANGMIDVPPENRAVVSAIKGGYIRTTPLLVGDKVRKGQALVTIENPEFVTMQQQYMEIKGQIDFLKADFERQETMVAENITSQKNYLKAESAYKTAVATLNGLKKQLELLNISTSQVENGNMTSVITVYAPISGSVTKVNVSKGTFVSPATMIMEIIDNEHIHLELSVFEKDIMKLQKGQKIEFKIPEASQDTFEAEVHLIGTSIDQNRTIKVHGHIKDESKYNFLTGMFVNASIVTDSKISKGLPSGAIVNVDGTDQVLMLDEKKGDIYYFKTTNVRVIDAYDGFSLIENTTHFNEEQQFLVRGAFNLLGE